MKRKLIRTSAFIRAAKRLIKRQPLARSAILDTLQILESDAFHPRLRTHKLKGELSGHWSCSAGYDLRIVFRTVTADNEESILLVSVGSHDEVY